MKEVINKLDEWNNSKNIHKQAFAITCYLIYTMVTLGIFLGMALLIFNKKMYWVIFPFLIFFGYLMVSIRYMWGIK